MTVSLKMRSAVLAVRSYVLVSLVTILGENGISNRFISLFQARCWNWIVSVSENI